MGLRVTDRNGQSWTYSTATYWSVEENGALSIRRREQPGLGAAIEVALFAFGAWINVERLEALPAAA